ncbi:hypothetical protein LTR37_018600 [Vermiconidia calcicola]|uniref:Uncharacterized protein n=1 Tax=Vermiconidia calcicola TaxID=1690605 RepID=A0ACC3MI87_9PEZI|nr:hypothetical protein LTR37_018600 [Vermiconidia calcicola]
MSEDSAPRNRKERRAAAKSSGKPVEPATSTPKLKMAQPDRSGPKSKTMMDLYEEKKALLEKGQPFDAKGEDAHVMDSGGNIFDAGLMEDEPIGLVGNAVFWSLSLSMVHLMLDVLVYSQYRQEMEWRPIIERTLFVLPVLFLLTLMLKSEIASRFEMLRQLLFFVVAVGAGCYVIHAANRFGYYAVMKRCPPLGTLWIWSVIEMRLEFAAASVAADLGYLWWMGYEVF